jgi:hypothetical protein
MIADQEQDLMKRIVGMLTSPSHVAREQDRTALLFAFRLSSSKGPVVTRGMRCLDPASLAPHSAVPSYVSNAEGEVLVLWQHRYGNPPPSVLLEVRLGNARTWTRLAEVPVRTVTRSTARVRDGLMLEIAPAPGWRGAREPKISKLAPGSGRRRRAREE